MVISPKENVLFEISSGRGQDKSQMFVIAISWMTSYIIIFTREGRLRTGFVVPFLVGLQSPYNIRKRINLLTIKRQQFTTKVIN